MFSHRQSLYRSGTGRCYLGKSWNEFLWAKGAFWPFFSSSALRHSLIMWSERIITSTLRHNLMTWSDIITPSPWWFATNIQLGIGWLWSVAGTSTLLIIFFMWCLGLRYSLQIRIAISYSITAALIIFWCFPGMFYLVTFGSLLYSWHHSLNSRICRYHLKCLYRLPDCSLPRMDMQTSVRGCWYHLGMSVFKKFSTLARKVFLF